MSLNVLVSPFGVSLMLFVPYSPSKIERNTANRDPRTHGAQVRIPFSSTLASNPSLLLMLLSSSSSKQRSQI